MADPRKLQTIRHGERVVSSGPLSPGTNYRILIDGEFGTVEAARLIEIATMLKKFVAEVK
jgi:hypothetical protein